MVRHSLRQLESDVVFERELADRIAQREQRAYYNDSRALRLQIEEGSPHCGSSTSNVVHDCNKFALYRWLQSLRKPVLDRKQPFARRIRKAFGVNEFATQLLRNQQPDKSAFDERPTHHFNFIFRKLRCKSGSKRSYVARVQA